MATLYITEFAREGVDVLGHHMPVARALPMAEQTLAFTGTSAASAAFNERTTLVRLHTDATVSVAFGTSPTATTSSMRLVANQTEYIAVPANSGLKVAAIVNT